MTNFSYLEVLALCLSFSKKMSDFNLNFSSNNYPIKKRYHYSKNSKPFYNYIPDKRKEISQFRTKLSNKL